MLLVVTIIPKTLVQAEVQYSNWSEWSDIMVEPSSTKEVEERIVENGSSSIYRYHYWINEYGNTHFCPYTGGYYYGGKWEKRYFDLSYPLISTTTKNHVTTWCKHYGCDDPANNKLPVYDYNGQSVYYEEVIQGAMSYKTQYRFRDVIYNANSYSNSVKAHIHSVATGGDMTLTYTNKNDIYHTQKASFSAKYCSCGELINGSNYSTVDLKHKFSNGTCSLCGATEAIQVAGSYYTIKDMVAIYEKTSSKSNVIRHIDKKGGSVTVLSVDISSANNYWGKVGEQQYIYMGNLSNIKPSSEPDIYNSNCYNEKKVSGNFYSVIDYGQCTWYVWGRVKEVLNEELQFRGRAKNWPTNALKHNKSVGYEKYTVSDIPRSNSIIVWDAGEFGHVAFVEDVQGDNIVITEANKTRGLVKSTLKDIKDFNTGVKQYNGYNTIALNKLSSYIGGNSTIKYIYIN